jgi:RNA polymerase sigma factor (TIGR02999 family)
MMFFTADGGRNRLSSDAEELFTLLYQELRQIAHARLRKNEPITLLDTTSLVHETYLRVVKAGRLAISDRSQFLVYSAHVMRSIVVDFVRQRRAERRGGDQAHERLETEQGGAAQPGEDEIMRVNDALDDLAKVDARLVKVVEMRYFAGLMDEEIAQALGVNERTVRRDWQKARMLLSLALQ